MDDKDKALTTAAAAPAPAAPVAPAPAVAPATPALPPAAPTVEGELEITGVAGKNLAIYGQNLGAKGSLTIAGRTIETTAWYTREADNTTVIKAVLPSDIGSGDVVISTREGRTHHGYLGKKSKK